MTRKLIMMIALLLLGAGVACTSKQSKAGDDRGIAVTAGGAVIVKYDSVVITLKGTGRANGRYEATRIAEGSLAPMVAGARRAAPTAEVRMEEPTQQFSVGSVTFYQRAFVTMPSDGQTEAVLRAVFDACADRRLCGWDVNFAPVDAAGAIASARRNAIAEARRNASELARTAGVRLGTPLAIREVTTKAPGLDRVTPQHFSADDLQAYEVLLEERRGETPKPIQLVTLEVRFEIER